MGLLNNDLLSVMELIWLITGILILSIYFGGMAKIFFINKKPSSAFQGKAVYVG